MVLQVIPTYMMYVFPTPKGILQKGTSYGEEQKQRKNGSWWLGRRFASQNAKEDWGYKIQK
jgi:hypothetical protein